MTNSKNRSQRRDRSQARWEIEGAGGTVADEAIDAVAGLLPSIVDEQDAKQGSVFVSKETQVAAVDFLKTFRSGCPARDNFLARVFGLFNEEPVHLWAEMDSSPYLYIGRPTIRPVSGDWHTTLDFALERRADGCRFVAEMKCWLAFENYRYITLTSVEQLRYVEKKSRAFRHFLEVSKTRNRFTCRATNRQNKCIPVEITGTILVWGGVSEDGKKAAMEEFGFADVLSVETIINDLLRAKNERYLSFLRERRSWCDELFAALDGSHAPARIRRAANMES